MKIQFFKIWFNQKVISMFCLDLLTIQLLNTYSCTSTKFRRVFRILSNNYDGVFKKIAAKSSCSHMFCKVGVLKNSAIFTEKHLCLFLKKLRALHLSLFFNKVAGLRRKQRNLPNFLEQLFYRTLLVAASVKGNAQFLFLRNPQKSSGNVCLVKIIKKHCHKKR